MNDEQLSSTHLQSSPKNEKNGEMQDLTCTEANENCRQQEKANLSNASENKRGVQKLLKDLAESSFPGKPTEPKEKTSLQKKRSTQDLSLQKTLSSVPSADADDSSQDAPLSIKNFFNVVRTFSKRKPKSPKSRPEALKKVKDAQVVVFERPTTPRMDYILDCVSRSLPPVFDFDDLIECDKSLDAEEQQEGASTRSEMLQRATQTTDRRRKESKSLSLERNHQTVSQENGFRGHRCSGFLPDALHEFGSPESALRKEPRKSSRSLGSLYGQLDEHETLLF